MNVLPEKIKEYYKRLTDKDVLNKIKRLAAEMQFQTRMFMVTLIVSALLVGAAIDFIRPEQKIDVISVLQIISVLAVLLHFLFVLISRNYTAESPNASMPEDDRQNP